ncbi:penicillin acylase family protein [Xanthomonas campestris pv. trichodesmae]|uniref:Penicillin acylase family protein n=1 Tax=Xanthomonas citri pv. vignicola TaxID=473426 RepID=A0AB33CJT7_XANCI|nr:penicillin acylase family protein [Xanthomonas citri]ASK93962.1 penicillin acylase family protein [Xanthomonas citri pv. vignicola]MBV6783384.1 penicillin acylase family protein [Xanthomonas campestris pv. trichodesmae]
MISKTSCLILCLAAYACVTWQVAAAEPSYTRLDLPDLQKPAQIRVDRWGVAHIYASSDDDVFFVQGFNVARDRLFQLDLLHRKGLGRLAAVFGPSYVEQDRASRLFLFRGDMRQEWNSYGKAAQRNVARFVAGINAYIAWVERNPQALPYEFRTLGYQPDAWLPEDVVRIRTTGLGRNVKSEVARAKVACKASLGVDAVRLKLQPAWTTALPDGLDPCLPDDVLKVYELATQSPRLAPGTTLAQTPAALLTSGEEALAEGSNNWVIAPDKSATGHAVLADDPHRAYTVPSLRYFVHLNSPGMNIIGAGEPAAPGVAIGHNTHSAFGLTIFNIDQEDLYVYRLNPRDPSQYWYNGAWVSMTTQREQIAVRGGQTQPVTLQFTRHGPVIYSDASTHRAYAVRSVWSQPGTSPYMGSLRYQSAASYPQFKRALAHWGAPSVNQLYAGTQGTIGWVTAGMTPRRAQWDGLLPVPGDGRYEWKGFLSSDALPSAHNAAQGFITTSNEMNLPSGYPAAERKIGFEWANGARHARITQVLSRLSKVTIEDSQALQNDQVSLPAQRLVALLAPLQSQDAATAAALALLKQWDGTVAATSPAAALEEVWFSRYLGDAYKSLVLTPAQASTFGAPDTDVLLEALEHPGSAFGPNPSAARDQLLLHSLQAAYRALAQLQGEDSSQWQWGTLHRNAITHPLSAAAGADRALLDIGPFAKGGSPYTPNQSSYDAKDFRQTIGPSARLIIDLGNWDNSRAVNYPGQSGDPNSPHYRDLAPMWLNGQYFPLLYTRAAVDAATEQVFELVPVPHNGKPPIHR